ncbi:hypothetical protein [Lysinibacillus sp. FSL K6-4013]|uniref:hypothetical protein n=1 Tax=Lysinibacillus sp. FSL K6-4013 TaxID=2921504 RepID=UPI00315B1870
MNNSKETLDLFSKEVLLTSGAKIEENHILPFYQSLYINDRLRVIVTIDGIDPDSYTIDSLEIIDKILSLNEYIEDDSETIIKIEIIKENKDTLNIYDIHLFITYLNELSLRQVLAIFSRFNNSEKKIVVSFSKDTKYTFSTNLFSTFQTNKEISDLNKKERLENLNLSSNNSGISNFNFIPEDFQVNSCSEDLLPLKQIFDRISFFLSIAFIADWAELDKMGLHFKILGYKKIDISMPISHKLYNGEVFFNIYRWIFENGNGSIEDKVGIARNIISRYLKYTDQHLTLDEDAYSSIITSYKIYLKENVEKYIETKNKVAELNTELTTKVKEMNQLIITNFKNNNLTLLSYFISLFIFNSVSFKQTTVFTKHTFAISFVVLLISSSYLWLTAYQLKKDIKINIRYFFAIKSIYKDFFDPSELNKIFNKRHFSYNINKVQQTFRLYMQAWIAELFLLFVLSIILTFGPQIKNLLSSYIKMVVISLTS